MIRIAFALIALLALAGGVAGAKNAAATPPPAATASLGVWTIYMTEIDVAGKAGDFSTHDHVRMTRNGGDVTADRMSGNYKSKVATFYGNVVVHDIKGSFGTGAGTQSKGPATLTCDQLRVDGKAKIYVATGHVHYVQGTTTSDSDDGTLDDSTHTMDLSGHVHIVDGDHTLMADRVHYNTLTGQMHAESDSPGSTILEFPGGNGPSIATPRPLFTIKNPLRKRVPKPTPSP